MNRITIISIVFCISLITLLSCSNKKNEVPITTHATPYTLTIPQFFPTQLNIPADNPLTIEGIKLGRYLFYDGRLSGRTESDSMMCCATCHQQSKSFECGVNNFNNGHPYGLTGIPTQHTMLPLINLVWNNSGYTWNGAIYNNNPIPNNRTLEDVVLIVIQLPSEIDGTAAKTVQTIASIPIYPPMFEAAFGTSEVTIDRICKAIAQFIRTLISSNSKFDKYMRGEAQLSSSELSGLVLFTTEQGADCFHCHGGGGNVLFTTNLFYNNAKDSVFTDLSDRYHVTFNTQDIGAYRAPTLRNIAYTAPYMHDGRFKTLDEVIDFYSEGLVASPYTSTLMHKIPFGGAHLTPQQKSDLKAFLNTLSDEDFINNPDFSKPADLP
ncbi:MAG: cytochrome c peroxidase [Bacteroidota bacterium]